MQNLWDLISFRNVVCLNRMNSSDFSSAYAIPSVARPCPCVCVCVFFYFTLVSVAVYMRHKTNEFRISVLDWWIILWSFLVKYCISIAKCFFFHSMSLSFSPSPFFLSSITSRCFYPMSDPHFYKLGHDIAENSVWRTSKRVRFSFRWKMSKPEYHVTSNKLQ